jgi:SAM-dependent methyltransferase
MIRQIVTTAAAVLAAPYMLRQVRKPTRWTGRFFAWTMNVSHALLTDWGLKQVSVEPAFQILDVGCGGGRTVGKLAARAPEGHVDGVDFAPGSVITAREENKGAIAEGRVAIHEASVSRLPFPDASFDLVTAVETHYYWPDPPADLREVVRTLKPGGTVIVIAESHGGGTMRFLEVPVMKLLGAWLPGAAELQAWFEGAGLAEVTLQQEKTYGWICVTGRRPV